MEAEIDNDDLPYFAVIDEALRVADIEGLIAGGAPSDEYAGEAEMIATAIGALPAADFTRDNVIEIISYIWADSFDLDEDGVEMRAEKLNGVADKVL